MHQTALACNVIITVRLNKYEILTLRINFVQWVPVMVSRIASVNNYIHRNLHSVSPKYDLLLHNISNMKISKKPKSNTPQK